MMSCLKSDSLSLPECSTELNKDSCSELQLVSTSLVERSCINTRDTLAGKGQVSKLVFYTKSTGTVISG